ncbi:MAG: hypothetical protein F4086_09120 [Gemmatimonadetes bacterium]|nr:hypothetical protein [Gemmatimonadota bacterium]
MRSEVKDLRAEVESLRERVEEVEGCVSGGPNDGDGEVAVDDVDAGQVVERHRPVVQVLRCIFPELITEQSEPGEEQVYGAATEDVIEWREAWAERRSARYTLDWLRAERKRIDLELRLIGVFGLTPPRLTRAGTNGVETAKRSGGSGRCGGCAGSCR